MQTSATSDWRPLILAAGLALGGAAQANTSASLYVQVGQNYPTGVVPAPQSLNDNKTDPGRTTSRGVLDIATAGPSAAARATAFALATAGHLAVRATSGGQVMTGHFDSQGNPSMPIEAGQATSEARAAWYDQVTFLDAAHDGQRGSATAVLQISGAVSALSPGFANSRGADGSLFYLDGNGWGAVQVAGNGLDWTSQTWDDGCASKGWAGWLACARATAYDPSGTQNYSVGGVINLPVVLDFTFGQPFSLGYSLVATSSANAVIAYYKASGSGESQGVADLSHTLLWGGLGNVFAADGSVVQGYTVASASGLDYRVAAVVPEPATYALWLAGLVSLGLLRRRNRR
jgi:hypothetical protein